MKQCPYHLSHGERLFEEFIFFYTLESAEVHGPLIRVTPNYRGHIIKIQTAVAHFHFSIASSKPTTNLPINNRRTMLDRSSSAPPSPNRPLQIASAPSAA